MARPATADVIKIGHVIADDGTRIVYREIGAGPLVILCHGWPEIWYSWRHQMPVLAAQGYRVVAPDLRGFGDSDTPPSVEQYSLKTSCGDLAKIIDSFQEPYAVVVGHDWGGFLAWRFALHYPHKVRAVASVCTPFLPRLPVYMSPAELAEIDRTLQYQAYFNEGDAAAKELNEDVDRTLRCLLRSTRPDDHIPGVKGGMVNGRFIAALGNPRRSIMFSQADHERYVDAYRRTGFAPSLNWYRNTRRNWDDERDVPMMVPHPALMVSAGRDRVLRPSLTEGMELYVPNLKRAIIPDAGHWVSNEQPDQLSDILVRWLGSLRASHL